MHGNFLVFTQEIIWVGGFVFDIRFFLSDTIKDDPSVREFNFISGNGNDALDKVDRRIARVFEHHYVASLWFPEVVTHFVGEDIITILKSVTHRAARNFVWLDGKKVDDTDDGQKNDC